MASHDSKPRILFLCHGLEANGGDRVVAAWMLHALAPLYHVNILTWAPPDLAALDRVFGTSIAGSSFEVQTPSRLQSWLVDHLPDDSFHQRANYLVRLAKRQARDFDAVVSCTFESDLGEPAIQYIHYPYIASKIDQWDIPGDSRLGTRLRGLLSGRTQPWMLISGYCFERLRSNYTLANSNWTRNRLTDLCRIPSEVLYPPAPGDYADTAWNHRRNAFVTIGRLHPDKRQDWIIEIMARVQREAPDVELHICGFADKPQYVRQLQVLAQCHTPWVRIHQNLTRKELIGLLSQCRYGIHALVDEHFGIAPAEIARAGCIPFVHASGGQVEIVNNDPRLCYSTAEEAAAKILAVMRDPALQDELRTSVHQGSGRFTPETFVREFRRHVAEFLSRKRSPA